MCNGHPSAGHEKKLRKRKDPVEEKKKSFMTLWLTGLPCSGKTTLARRLAEILKDRGLKVVHLDGDDLRDNLNSDLGFSPHDRKENLRRAAHVSKLFNDHGNMVIASFVSPKEEYRAMVKEIIGNIKLVFVKCRVEVCKKRDVKGMYAKAKNGDIKEFTGASAFFEEPLNADIIVDTDRFSIEECVNKILNEMGFFAVVR